MNEYTSGSSSIFFFFFFFNTENLTVLCVLTFTADFGPVQMGQQQSNRWEAVTEVVLCAGYPLLCNKLPPQSAATVVNICHPAVLWVRCLGVSQLSVSLAQGVLWDCSKAVGRSCSCLWRLRLDGICF